MNQIREALYRRLAENGIYPELMPGFIKFMFHAIQGSSSINVEEANKRLHFLGWDDFEVDYHTLQLLIAGFESTELFELQPLNHAPFRGRYDHIPTDRPETLETYAGENYEIETQPNL